jgi:ketosteroid isomerase-like protein
MGDPRQVVEHYYAVVGDLASTEPELAALLHPDVRITEHPNAVNPRGSARNRDEALDAFSAGKQLLEVQRFDVVDVLVDGDRVAVKAEWTGKIKPDSPALGGLELRARIAALLRVADEMVIEHETYDCYEPFRE